MSLLGSVLFFVLVSWLVSVTSVSPFALISGAFLRPLQQQLGLTHDADLKIITAKSGDDVTLPCEDTNITEETSFEWIRTDLPEGECVFVYRSHDVNRVDQHKSYRNRVSLKNSQMKDGNLSVVLKDVNINDNGTYLCKLIQKSYPLGPLPKVISTINLYVSPPPPPGDEGENKNGGREKEGDKNEGSRDRLGLIAVTVPLAVLVFVFILLICRRRNGSNQISRGSNNQQDPEVGLLNLDSNGERNTTNPEAAIEDGSDPEAAF